MKKQLLLLAGMLCFVVTAWAAPTAKAIYCAANTTLYFTYDEVTYNTSTAYEQLDGNTPTNIYNSLNPVGGYYYIPSITRELPSAWDEVPTVTVGDGTWRPQTPWYNIRKDITTLKFLDNFIEWKPTSIRAYFADMRNLTTVLGGENLNVSEVTDMQSTFACCSSLKNLDFLSEWNTEKVTSLWYTFAGCESLENLSGLKNWNTSELVRFQNTFDYCKSLTSLEGLENWDVSKCKQIINAFYDCFGIEDVDALANWNLENTEALQRVFDGCVNLKNVDGLSNWNVSNVKDLNCLFEMCLSLSDISGLSNWDVSNVDNICYLLRRCTSLTNLDALSKWKTTNMQTIECAFQECINLTNIDALSNWDTQNVVNMFYAFFRCFKIKNVDPLSEWNTSKTKSLFGVFQNCESLENIEGLRNWDTNAAHDFGCLFLGCISLSSIEPIYNWETPNMRSLSHAFYNCQSLTGRIDLSKWDMSNLCKKWTEFLRTSYYSTPMMTNGWTLHYAFADCPNIIGVTLGKGNFGQEVIPMSYLDNAFQNCSKLRYIDISGCTDTYGNVVSASRTTDGDMFYTVPRTCVIYLPSGNTQPTKDDLENVVYTASDETLQCDKYYSEDKVDIELPHRFHADLATYERTFNSNYGGVILPYPVKINDNDEDEFQPFLLQREFKDHMFFKGIAEVSANTPFCFKRKQASTDMTFRMEDLWVESTYDISGETSDNVEEGFAWKTQGFYVNNVIEPENGTFSIPTMDDYVGTENVDYEVDHVYYLSKNRFYRCDDAKLTLAPHRILFYGLWEKYSGTDPEMSGSFDFEELGDDVVDAIQAAETDMDEAKAAAIYDANGNRLSKTQHGLNILRMSDGSVKKVIKK